MSDYIIHNGTLMSSELYHYGVKGMKWGVRRYQNKDGTLTDAGKKRYDSMSGEQLYKHAKKQIQKARSKQYGKSNQWLSGQSIGDNSKRALDARSKAIKDAKNSKEYKDAVKRLYKFENSMDVERGKMSFEEWSKGYDDAAQNLEKISKRISDMGGTTAVYNKGLRYADQFMNGLGKDISVGYLKDLGLDDDTARNYVDKMLKSGRTLGGI